MILYPTIQLQGGRCVALHRGRLEEPEIWHVDPVVKAASFAAAGASWMQVIDFDAVAGLDSSRDIVARIIRETAINVVVAGGIRTRERAEAWLDAGAAHVVFGTSAVINPDEVLETARFHPDAVILAVDVFNGRVMSHGWRETSSFTPEDFIAAFEEAPLAAIQITDIDAYVGDTDAVLALISALAGKTRKPVIASGMVRTLDDISRLKYVGNVAGVVIGRALFRRTVDLREALAVANTPAEKVAPFA
ncbi:1-(5-phosphoribosyl)-5-[(5-phosphoribosylamino)methylideneamino] imidazole-4-carboxamide isomerase [Pararhodobacter sp. SW119]|uniref:1-(5-phosphoribosyl)-5-[(5- phosphoribosylamino)methylideneamino]imidazole-4- carboxamide isomerase n=1 Tax=Pararhodobacter sp. SW119 TaxID=2780075 RepID=UPI001AE08A02|nr:1-(5-phosphoribosyl)-5-[(5-phosphoribosylamino)methylideneamino] imidazole-4-carboxamide isomerase [Pararhodobacter sp. SW119]